MAEHDNGYKLLFSHRELVRDLLRAFVNEQWVAEIDLRTLAKVNSSYVSEDLKDRHDDLVWKVKWRGKWLYVYLLLEFQATVDPFMALRVLVYVGLLYQDLIRGKAFEGSKLPPVIPIVLYNGDRPWTAPADVSELIADVGLGLEQYRPNLRYLLLEERAYTEEELRPLENLAAAVFRVENSRTVESMSDVMRALAEYLAEKNRESLARTFTSWITKVVLPTRLPGVELPPMKDLIDVQSVLQERTKDWTIQWRNEGMKEGREEGMKEGREEGMKEGEAAMLALLLEQRFGTLDETARKRVAEADADTLLCWAERLLTAGRIQDVFGA